MNGNRIIEHDPITINLKSIDVSQSIIIIIIREGVIIAAIVA
jgi:hypothetical protein